MGLLSVIAGRATVALAALAALAACQTGPLLPLMSPLEAGGGFGHSERQLSEHRYEVAYLGPRVRTWLERKKRAEDVERARNLVYDLALWRAAELATENEYAAFTVEDSRSDVEIEIIEEGPFFPDYGLFHHHGYGYHGFHDYALGLRSAWLRAHGALTVAMQPEVSGNAFDAAATVKRLREKRPEALAPQRY